MTAVIYGLHLMVVIALILMVLMQRSEGGALGMGGGSGSLMTGRGAANALARGTGALGAVFFLTSMTLTMMAGGAKTPSSVVDQPASFSISFEPVQRFFEDVTKGFSGGAAKPATVTPPPETIATPVPADPILPASTGAPATGDVAPAPSEALTRAAPLELAAPSVRPAAPVLAVTPPAARPPLAAAAAPAAISPARAPASVSASTPATAATAPKPAESTLPQVPAERPRGRAGPDE